MSHANCSISTHALTWSATDYGVSSESQYSNFNSRAHVERDVVPIRAELVPFVFQLTRSRGARRSPNPQHQLFSSFQLTRSRGARLTARTIPARSRSFQLTRSRGARHKNYGEFIMLKNFNSRAHVERDPLFYFDFSRRYHFNSRAHVERDMEINTTLTPREISTHALTWSAT